MYALLFIPIHEIFEQTPQQEFELPSDHLPEEYESSKMIAWCLHVLCGSKYILRY